ncbi:Uncharacterized protein FWK35_00006802, partial [Aphis craccivora]
FRLASSCPRRVCSSGVRACVFARPKTERAGRGNAAATRTYRTGRDAGGTATRACVRDRDRPTERVVGGAARARGPCECVRERCHARHALGRNAGPAPPRALKFGTGPGSQPWRPSAAAAPPSAAVGTAKEVREVNSPGRLRSDFVPRPH